MSLKVVDSAINILVESEIVRARRLYPTNKHRHIAMIEEVGELTKSILDYENGKCKRSDILLEAVQSIAMIKRLIFEGDDNLKFEPFVIDDLIKKVK